MRDIITPVKESDIAELEIGDLVTISGSIYCGRDAVLPKLVRAFEDGKLANIDVSLKGSVIFHTAVSPAGVGPTSSNKLEIESSIAPLSRAGVKIHLGKGAISEDTMKSLDANNSIYAVIPPVTALLQSRIEEQRIAAFEEEGMEALHLLKIFKFPAIIAVAHGQTIYT